MGTVIKPNNKVRICMDPRDLNKALQREHFPLKTIDEVIADMPQAKSMIKAAFCNLNPPRKARSYAHSTLLSGDTVSKGYLSE